MATNNIVHVKDIDVSTSDEEIKQFFSFCGKVTDVHVTTDAGKKNATVTFEKETAKKTALLLNNTQLGPSKIVVTSANGDSDDDGSHFARERDSDEITQEEKPRTRILAEYLAQGYVVGDATIQRAIELDHKHGVSNRFLSTLQNLDHKYHATDRAKATDQSYGISAKGKGLLFGLNSYFEKATNTPTGQRIVKFYTDSTRQVQDIHTEARRLADLKTEEAGGSAYKAAGLEKVFGKEKPAEDTSAQAAPATATDTKPTAPLI